MSPTNFETWDGEKVETYITEPTQWPAGIRVTTIDIRSSCNEKIIDLNLGIQQSTWFAKSMKIFYENMQRRNFLNQLTKFFSWILSIVGWLTGMPC